jgi:exosortase
MHSSAQTLSRRFSWLALYVFLSLLIFWHPLLDLLNLSWSDDNASHLVLIPFLFIWLLWFEKEKIFKNISFDLSAAAVPFLLALALTLLTLRNHSSWTPGHLLSAHILSLVLLWIAGFLACFGRLAARQGHFALLFLFLMVPLPDFLLERVIYFLQWGSAELSALLFDLCSVPALREGFTFHLAHVSIEVARECSGIRSSLALFILALIVVHLYLHSFWRKGLFLLVGIIVMVVKNAVRIVALTILASYVDPSFLFGRLHRDGGVVFFLLGVALLVPFFWLLQKGDTPRFESSVTPPNPEKN